MPEIRKKYDREFRDGAVRIVEETGKPIAQVARTWGSTRARWATGSPRPGRPVRAPRACGPATSRAQSGCARRTPSCGWSAMSQAIGGPVGEGGDEVSVARFIADQRTNYRVPHTVTCALLGVSTSWFYKWISRTPTTSEQRRAAIDAAVAEAFKAARGLHGSPRLHADLRAAGWTVSAKTVADSMRRQGLIARKIRRRGGLTRQDKTAPKFPDLLKRDFTASAPNSRWVGDMTEIPTAAGKLYLATVIDLYSRRLLGAATRLHPAAPPGRAPRPPPRSPGGLSPNHDARAPPRRRQPHPRGHLPPRPRLAPPRRQVHRPVPPAPDPPVHGPGRVLLRQRRGRG